MFWSALVKKGAVNVEIDSFSHSLALEGISLEQTSCSEGAQSGPYILDFAGGGAAKYRMK